MINPYPFFGVPNFRRPHPYYSYKIPNNTNYYSHKNMQKPYSPNISDKKIEENIKYSSNNVQNKNFCINDVNISQNSSNSSNTSNSSDVSDECFEIFGLKLYFDDLLIIALLFFLYQEDVKDTYLYIALILLLLS